MAEQVKKIKCCDKLYSETLYFDIKQTAKYCKMLGLQLFSQLNYSITPEEWVVLDIVSKTPDICQRDLAKNLLKDRANTGRLLDSLEKQEMIKRIVDVKNNRLVKRIVLTEKGYDDLQRINKELEPIFDKVSEKFSKEETRQTKQLLKKLRDSFQEIVNLKI